MRDVEEAHVSQLVFVCCVSCWMNQKLKNKGYLSITRRTSIQLPVWLETPLWHYSSGLLTVFMKIKKIKTNFTGFFCLLYDLNIFFVHSQPKKKNNPIWFIPIYTVYMQIIQKWCKIYILKKTILKYKQYNFHIC